MLEMETSVVVVEWHIGREGMGDVGEIRVRHLGSYSISTCGQLHPASSPVDVASFGSGNLAYVAMDVFHKAYLHSMVVVGGAYKSYAVASE